MIKQALLALGGLVFFIGAGAADDQPTSYPLRVETRKVDHDFILVATNDGPASITMTAQIKGNNIASDTNWPFITALKPNETLTVARIFAANAAKGYSFTTRYSHAFGNWKQAPDPLTPYRLPFQDGTRIAVGQAYGGQLSSHDSPENMHAVDFSVPERTPVVAARGGTVIETEDKYTEGGKRSDLLRKANHVVIQHTDGSIAQYAHLAPRGVTVRPGQTVTQGQLIGYSGNTGYSSGPHLHFAVSRTLVGKDLIVRHEAVPVDFFGFNPPVRFRPIQSMTLLADYSHPAPAGMLALPPPVVAQNSQRAVLDGMQSEEALPVNADTGEVIVARPVPTWIERLEQSSGYPLWVLIGFMIGGALIIRLSRALFQTFEMQE